VSFEVKIILLLLSKISIPSYFYDLFLLDNKNIPSMLKLQWIIEAIQWRSNKLAIENEDTEED
jgi:hypothetical protein